MQYQLDLAQADRNYVLARVGATNNFYRGAAGGSGLWSARSGYRTSLANAAESARSSISGASRTYDQQWTGYVFDTAQTVNSAYTTLSSGIFTAGQARLTRDIASQSTAFLAINTANDTAGRGYVRAVTDWMSASAQTFRDSARAGAFYDTFNHNGSRTSTTRFGATWSDTFQPGHNPIIPTPGNTGPDRRCAPNPDRRRLVEPNSRGANASASAQYAAMEKSSQSA